MDFNIEVRRKQLENLDQFINSSEDRVESILDYLGWKTEKINESHREMVKCLVNPNHRIPASKASAHMHKCSFRKEGYVDNEKYLSEPNSIPGSTVIIDDATKVQVLNRALRKNPLMRIGWRSNEPTPRSSDRLLSTFTPDERGALYDHSVASTEGPPQAPEFNTTESKKEEKTNLSVEELKALERDSKRRRIKYRAKSVHSSRKNTTEITREIINGQMDAYEDWLRHELGSEVACRDGPESSVRYEEKRSRSRDSQHSRYSVGVSSRSRSRSRSKRSSAGYEPTRDRHTYRRKGSRDRSYRDDRRTSDRKYLSPSCSGRANKLNK